ncbi:tRNA (uridine(54)-C5)-methyltransferase TrmA [Helicobacter monodelphidis]|uniref:tRNA (uridine(54)-C5)-methyltransferase TrmA n=1 Tax=Helicobacter sp. 15-1451 TaxID=2004995 RepID=UPI000DCB8F9C|nr:tRNA (uridine(54)-C5)-methyltransferase TrmA [Helicobacter sp. 15-1451]RAX58629.1 tRNA (uridine(54)-C5)-methyltransferase TrmA [Helicobacter sp. 15-1451]
MNCLQWETCGGCSFKHFKGGDIYERQFAEKCRDFREILCTFLQDVHFTAFSSPHHSFRARAEFGIFHKQDKIFYTLRGLENQPVFIQHCEIVLQPIQDIFMPLLEYLSLQKILSQHLFGVNFLATQTEILITLLYHKFLKPEWEESAKQLQVKLQKCCSHLHSIHLIGRSRKQKIALQNEFITQTLQVKLNQQRYDFVYRLYEGAFSQPNSFMNVKMIEWVAKQISQTIPIQNSDLLELYCGLGNFTFPLSRYFQKVLATEVSRVSLKAAIENCHLNHIQNTTLVRMHAEDLQAALLQKRIFKRFSDINLQDFHFSTLFVDPPRAGLGNNIATFATTFPYIAYVSCNPRTMLQDLKILSQTHRIISCAVFDQFPYTHHLESAIWLQKIKD